MPAVAQQPPEYDPYAQGNVRVSLVIGASSTHVDDYLVLGAGVGYFVLRGLELGLDYEAWLVGQPLVNRISPETRYVFAFVPTVKPYLGAFYRHTFVSGEDGLNSVGGRTGVYYVSPGSRIYLGGGVIYERFLGCDTDDFIDCDTIYPEFAVGATF